MPTTIHSSAAVEPGAKLGQAEKKRQLTYVNAGHNPPLLRRADGTVEELEPTGPVIGLVDEPHYEERSVSLHRGDLLVMYTDGVTEAINKREEMFSEKRLRAAIQESNASVGQDTINFNIRNSDGSCPSLAAISTSTTIFIDEMYCVEPIRCVDCLLHPHVAAVRCPQNDTLLPDKSSNVGIDEVHAEKVQPRKGISYATVLA